MTCERCQTALRFTHKGNHWVGECPICGKMKIMEEPAIVSDGTELSGKGWTPKEEQPDMINHPPHYQIGGIETIEIIQAMLTEDEYRGYLKGNILKYRERAEHKGNREADYAKAKWYMARLQDLDVW